MIMAIISKWRAHVHQFADSKAKRRIPCLLPVVSGVDPQPGVGRCVGGIK